jgi:hypothetical protein
MNVNLGYLNSQLVVAEPWFPQAFVLPPNKTVAETAASIDKPVKNCFSSIMIIAVSKKRSDADTDKLTLIQISY